MASETDVHDISKQIKKLEIEHDRLGPTPQIDVSSDLESALSFDGRKDSLSDSNLIPRGAIRTSKPSNLTEPYPTSQLRSDEPYGNQIPNRQSGGQWNDISQQAHQTGNDTVIENRNASLSAELAVPTPMNQDTSYLSTRQVSNQDLPSYNENDWDLVLDTIQRDTTTQAGLATPVDRTRDSHFNKLLQSLMEYDNGSQKSTSTSTSRFFQKEPSYQKTENSRLLPSSNATPVNRNKHAGNRSSRTLQSESLRPFSSKLTANVSDSTVENCPPQKADSFGSGWPQTCNAETCQPVSHFNVSSSNDILPIISEISSSNPVTPIHIILQEGNQNIAPSATQLMIQSLSQQTAEPLNPALLYTLNQQTSPPFNQPATQQVQLPLNHTTQVTQPVHQTWNQTTSPPFNQPVRQAVQLPLNQTTPVTQPVQQTWNQTTSSPFIQQRTQPVQQTWNQTTSSPFNQPGTQPVQLPWNQTTSPPFNQPVTQPVQLPLNHTTTQPFNQPGTQPVPLPWNQTTTQPFYQPGTQPVQLPLNQTTTQPFNQPGTQPVQLPWNQTTSPPFNQPEAQPVQLPLNQTTSQPFNQPGTQPIQLPLNQTTSPPFNQPATPQVQQTLNQTTSPPFNQPGTQPVPLPWNQTTTQPFNQLGTQPVQLPLNQTTTQHFNQPGTQPVQLPLNQTTSPPYNQQGTQPVQLPWNQTTSQPFNQPGTQPVHQTWNQTTRQQFHQPEAQMVQQTWNQTTTQQLHQPVTFQPLFPQTLSPTNTLPPNQTSVQTYGTAIRQSFHQPEAQLVQQTLIPTNSQPLNQPGTQPKHQTLTTSISQHCTQSLQQGFRIPVNSQTVQQSIQTLPVTLNPLYLTPFQQSQPRIQLSHQTSNQPNRPILPKPPQSVNAIQTPRLKSTSTHCAVEKDKRVAPTRNVGKNKQKEDKARRDIRKLTDTQLQYVDPEKGDTMVHVYSCRGPHENYQLQALLERFKQENMIDIINSKNKKNQTALYCAVTLNYDKVIKTLVKFGADPNIKAQIGDEQSAPIHIAACSGTTKTLEALLEASNIDIDSINSYGQTALHCAIVQQFVAQKDKDGSRKVAMEKLLQKRANHTLQDTKGRTPLIYCVLQKQKDLLTTLVNHIEPARRKTAIRMKDHFGKSAWDYAEELTDSDEMFYSNYLSRFQE